MRGRRVKALRRRAVETLGYNLPKTRYQRVAEKPPNLFFRILWFLTRYEPREWVHRHPSAWRRWKRFARRGPLA